MRVSECLHTNAAAKIYNQFDAMNEISPVVHVQGKIVITL